MDKSYKYTLMCEKAGEIQKDHIFEDGDYFAKNMSNCEDRNDLFVEEEDYYEDDKQYRIEQRRVLLYFDCSDEYYMYDTTGAIWLPRQDQLQNMITKKYFGSIAIFEEFFRFFDENWEDINFDSAEQLWLVFVMNEEFGKQWSEEKSKWMGL